MSRRPHARRCRPPACWPASARCCRRTATRGRRGSCPSSSSCTASACRRASSADRGSSGCSPATCPRTRIRTSASAPGLRVSAHVLIRRDGELVQYVPFNERAWHAGRSAWQGRERLQRLSRSASSCEGTDEVPYDDRAVRRAARSCCRCCSTPIPRSRASASSATSDVAPGRKTDPGASFDWPQLRAALSGAPRASLSAYFAAAVVAPEHFAAVLVARQHARDHEQQVGQAVEVAAALPGCTALLRRASVHTRRSARRTMVRARWQAAAAGPAAGQDEILERAAADR